MHGSHSHVCSELCEHGTRAPIILEALLIDGLQTAGQYDSMTVLSHDSMRMTAGQYDSMTVLPHDKMSMTAGQYDSMTV